MTSGNLPKHLETIINEACWGVPGVGQLTGEGKLRAILEAANNLSAVMTDPAKLPEGGVPDAAVKEIGSLARQLGEAEAQRDELAELLRGVLEDTHVSMGEDIYADITDLLDPITAALAKLEEKDD